MNSNDRDSFKEYLHYLESMLDNKRQHNDNRLSMEETAEVRGQINLLKTLISDVKERLNIK